MTVAKAWLLSVLDVSGRTSRAGFWATYLLLGLYFAALAAIFLPPTLRPGRVVLLLYLFLSSLPMFAVLVPLVIRRLHDRGRSAWWAARVGGPPYAVLLAVVLLLVFDALPRNVMFVAALVTILYAVFPLSWIAIEIMLLRGQRGPNLYGPDPLA